jgi:gamma-glutamyltranspeptidase/glutathione hydrolase
MIRPAALAAPLSLLTLSALGCRGADRDLSPGHWPPDVLTRLVERSQRYGQPPLELQARRGMVASTTDPIAIHAGAEALAHGGNALDALATASFTQIVLEAGSGVSFAGQMTLLYFDAASGKVYGVDGSFNTVKAEVEPQAIPTVDSLSGRSALVPGLMAGFAAAHRRFGRLPFATLLEPAIYFADQGFRVDSRIARRIETRGDRLRRIPAARRVFSRTDGDLLREGDTLRQPELAATLRHVAAEGVDYLYRGAWASELVDSIRAYGGNMTVDDLAGYTPVWAQPVETTFRDRYRIIAPGSPSFGGVSMAEAFNLLELADLPHVGHYRESPTALAAMLTASEVGELLGPPMAGAPVPRAILDKYFPGADLSPEVRVTKAHASLLWAKIRSPEWPAFRAEAVAGRMRGSQLIDKLLQSWGRRSRPQHTAGVVAVDSEGNVAVVMHSINSSFWGSGIMVGGIAIPDPAGFQQFLIASVGPGAKLPEPDNPLIVLEDGKPVLAGSSVGAGLHEAAIQGVVDVLEFGLSPQQAANMPSLRKNWPLGEPLRFPSGPTGFPDSTLRGLRERGFDVEIKDSKDGLSLTGYWVAIAMDRKTGILRSGLTPGLNGGAEGH